MNVGPSESYWTDQIMVQHYIDQEYHMGYDLDEGKERVIAIWVNPKEPRTEGEEMIYLFYTIEYFNGLWEKHVREKSVSEIRETPIYMNELCKTQFSYLNRERSI